MEPTQEQLLPSGIELVGEYFHEWGTEYNGLLLFEAESSGSFLDWWSKFKDGIRCTWKRQTRQYLGEDKQRYCCRTSANDDNLLDATA